MCNICMFFKTENINLIIFAYFWTYSFKTILLENDLSLLDMRRRNESPRWNAVSLTNGRTKNKVLRQESFSACS